MHPQLRLFIAVADIGSAAHRTFTFDLVPFLHNSKMTVTMPFATDLLRRRLSSLEFDRPLAGEALFCSLLRPNSIRLKRAFSESLASLSKRGCRRLSFGSRLSFCNCSIVRPWRSRILYSPSITVSTTRHCQTLPELRYLALQSHFAAMQAAHLGIFLFQMLIASFQTRKPRLPTAASLTQFKPVATQHLIRLECKGRSSRLANSAETEWDWVTMSSIVHYMAQLKFCVQSRNVCNAQISLSSLRSK